MSEENVILLTDIQEIKRERELESNYSNLLGTLSVSEIFAEIFSLVDDLKDMINLKREKAKKGQMILKELENRSLGPEQYKHQISYFLHEFEKQMSSLEK